MSTETAPSNQTYLDALKVLERWKTEGATRDEADAFIKGSIEELQNDTSGKFAENVAQVGEWALQVDAAFVRVTNGFTDVRWNELLSLSRDVASETAAVLKRFDRVYLGMIGMILSDQDRQDVISEFGVFINEDKGRSKELAEGFRKLRDDIDNWVASFDSFIQTTDAELQAEAAELQQQIEQLRHEIAKLLSQRNEAIDALVGFLPEITTWLGFTAVIASSVAVLAIQGAMEGKQIELDYKREQLAEVNKNQEGLANIKSQFDGFRPDIFFICDKLAIFGDIWASAQAQLGYYQEKLKTGMGILTDERFKLESQLSQELSRPIINGLEKYATQLQSYPLRSA